MVFYFKSTVVSPPALIYMGKDKYENEKLIRWGWPEDVWFHVHNFSSAHVYLRLEKDQCIDNIPKVLLEDVAQLVKFNSIQGNKTNNIDVVYTLWTNLRKTPDMEPGQVAYIRDDDVKKLHVEKRKNEIINRLNKSKSEDFPDLRQQREERDARERNKEKQLLKIKKEREEQDLQLKKYESEVCSYSVLFKHEKMMTNHTDGNDSDDFM